MIDMSGITASLAAMPDKIERATWMYASTISADLESYMKQNRPWHDRTGQARQRLRGYPQKYDTGVRINLEHGVDYGIYLEYSFMRCYAIIEPTIRKHGKKVFDSWQRMVKQL